MPLDALVKQYAGAYADSFDWPQPSPRSEDEDEDKEDTEGNLPPKSPCIFFCSIYAFAGNTMSCVGASVSVLEQVFQCWSCKCFSVGASVSVLERVFQCWSKCFSVAWFPGLSVTETPLGSPHEAVLIDSVLSVDQHSAADKPSSPGADGKPKRDIAEVAAATDLILPKGSARTTSAVSQPVLTHWVTVT